MSEEKRPKDAKCVQLYGSRVVLSDFEKKDLDGTYISWLNDPEVVRYSNQRFSQHSLESCERYRRTFKGTGNYFLSVQRKDNQCKIGTVTAYINPHHRTADLGILIGDKSVWGCGYGIDAWMTLVHWVEVDHSVRKITAGALSLNKPMIKILEKSEFHVEAVRHNQEIYRGVPEDIVLYAKFI